MSKMLAASVALALMAGMVAPAHATDIVCQIIDQRGHKIFYDLAPGPNGWTEEGYARDGNVDIHWDQPKPIWHAVPATDRPLIVLEPRNDPGWAVAFFVLPDPRAGQAGLFHNAHQVGTGRCVKGAPPTTPAPTMQARINPRNRRRQTPRYLFRPQMKGQGIACRSPATAATPKSSSPWEPPAPSCSSTPALPSCP